MQTITQKLVIASLCSLISITSAAQEIIYLKCEGELKTSVDGAKGVREPATVDISINLINSTFEAGSFWGCLANIGESNFPPLKCHGLLPIQVSESEFRFKDGSSNDRYDGSTSMVINRYTGSLSVSSSGIAKPAANATWKLTIIGGRLQCKPQEKKF